MILTNSSMNTYRRCPRMFAYQYVWLLTGPREPGALAIGSSVHEGLDLLAQGATDTAARVAVLRCYDKIAAKSIDDASDEIKQRWGYDRAKAYALLQGYLEHYKHDDIKHLDSEMEFVMALKNPSNGQESAMFLLGGKLDGIIESGGVQELMEHKTTSDDVDSPTSIYWRKLAIDPQLTTYWDAAHAMGFDVQRVRYNVLRKPSVRPKTVPLLDANGLKVVVDANGNRAFTKPTKKLPMGKPRQSAAKGMSVQSRPETPEEYGTRLTQELVSASDQYYHRRVIMLKPDSVEEARYDRWDTSVAIGSSMASGKWGRNTCSCSMWNRTCPFFDLCVNNWHDGDDLPIGFNRKERAHEELTEKTNEGDKNC